MRGKFLMAFLRGLARGVIYQRDCFHFEIVEVTDFLLHGGLVRSDYGVDREGCFCVGQVILRSRGWAHLNLAARLLKVSVFGIFRHTDH